MAKYVPSPRDWIREHTPNTKSPPTGGFRFLLQNRASEGLLLFCRRHHVIAPPSH